jgi:hypothetical protein
MLWNTSFDQLTENGCGARSRRIAGIQDMKKHNYEWAAHDLILLLLEQAEEIRLDEVEDDGGFLSMKLAVRLPRHEEKDKE